MNEMIDENRFNVKIESKIIEDILKVIRELQSEVIFIFDKEGLKFNLIDPANVSLMDGFIKQSLFLNFELNADVVKIGFYSDNLYKIFKENKKTFVVFEGNTAMQELNLI